MNRTIQMSQRLSTIAGMVTPGMRTADVGTDHAYVPVWLVQTGRVPQAIAMDINRGPLQHARETIRSAALEEKIQTRLSDGLQELGKEEADCIVIAGMGGALTIRILQDGRFTLAEGGGTASELVLAPQSEIADVRRYLREHGWQIIAEEMVLEDGKYYPVMKVHWQADHANTVRTDLGPGNVRADNDPDTVQADHEPGTARTDHDPDTPTNLQAAHGIEENGEQEQARQKDLEDLYGPCLLKERHPVLHSFLEKELRVREQILESLRSSAGAQQRKTQVMEEAGRIRGILENWGQPE